MDGVYLQLKGSIIIFVIRGFFGRFDRLNGV